jgi:hypothetical protein
MYSKSIARYCEGKHSESITKDILTNEKQEFCGIRIHGEFAKHMALGRIHVREDL